MKLLIKQLSSDFCYWGYNTLLISLYSRKECLFSKGLKTFEYLKNVKHHQCVVTLKILNLPFYVKLTNVLIIHLMENHNTVPLAI